MDSLNCALELVGAHDARDSDRRRRDDLDVDARLRERAEHLRRHAGVALHAGADQRDLADLRVALDVRRADLRGNLLEDRVGNRDVVLRDRERDARRPVLGDVLDDHVDVHAGLCEALEDSRRCARTVGHAGEHDLRLGGVVCDAGDDRLLEHYPFLLADPGALAVAECRPHPELHTVAAGDLDRPERHHLGAGRGHLEHLLVRHGVELQRLGHEPWIGGVDAVHVGEDLARVCAECCRERDRRRVGPAATERGHVVRHGRHTLEAGDEDDWVLFERLVDPARSHLDDLRLRVAGVRDDPGLRAGQRDGLVPEIVDRHRAERVRDPFAGRDEHVVLPRVGLRRDLVCQADQLVRRRAHRGEHADDLRARLAGRDEPFRDALQLRRCPRPTCRRTS